MTAVTSRLSILRSSSLALAAGAASIGCGAWGNDEVDLARCAPSSNLKPSSPESDGSGEHLVVDATKTLGTALAVEAEGSGDRFVGAIHLHGGIGTVDLGCESVNVAVYDTDANGYVWAIGVASDRFYTLSFHCTDSALDTVYYRSTDGTRPSSETATGICNEASQQQNVEFDFPAVDMAVPRPIGGFTIDGDGIHLPSGARGSITLDGTDHSMVAFSFVDCREGCPDSPWFEVDTLIWDSGSKTATLGILGFDRPGNPINLTTRVQMPGFVLDFPETTFNAAFTTP